VGLRPRGFAVSDVIIKKDRPMNLWSDPHFLVWQVLQTTGNLPVTLVELIIGAWALRSLPERPRAAKLMLIVVALLLVQQFGLPRVSELLFMIGGFGGIAGGLPGLFLIYSLSLALTIALCWIAIKAAFGREEFELPEQVRLDSATAELPGEHR
jgi:hypothetical protein